MITKYEFASIWFNLILFNLVGPVHNNLKFFFFTKQQIRLQLHSNILWILFLPIWSSYIHWLD